MAETTEQGLFPAEHRALRELAAVARHLAGRWERLARGFEDRSQQHAVLLRGAGAGRELAVELAARTRARDLEVTPAAIEVGRGLASMRILADTTLERNQAMRTAVVDVVHVTVLLEYLVELAGERGDLELGGWERAWHDRLAEVEAEARAAAAALGHDPDGAIAPVDAGLVGRAGHGLAAGVGTLGEAIDNSPLGRVARRLTRRA